MGVLQWTPDQFWKASPFDLFAAADGWRDAYGMQTKGQPSRVDRKRARIMRQQLEAYIADIEYERKRK